MKRILLVEDNADNRAIYGILLSHVGYDVVEAVDGETGIALARQRRPDLILMDISLPRISGWDATRLLKEDPDTAPIPVIALTAHAYPRDRKLARELGFAAYLAKPVEPRVVVEEVARVLTAPRPVALPVCG